jgi:hypothetical protein
VADAEVQLQPDGSGKQVDCSTVTTGAGTVYRQRNIIGDPSTAAALAAVLNAEPSASSYGLVTRPIHLNWVKSVNLSPTTLSASASYTQTAIDLGDTSSAGPGWSRFRVIVNSDVAGTLNIEQSLDNSTWMITLGKPIPAATPSIYESLITCRYIRINYVNGSSNQTAFRLGYALVAI